VDIGNLLTEGSSILFYQKVIYIDIVEKIFILLLIIFCSIAGLGLLVFGIRGTRESKARDGRTYKRGRI